MATINNPCYNCVDRAAGCHAQCNKYIEWKDKNSEPTAKKIANNAVIDLQRKFQSGFKKYNSGSSYHRRGK